MRNSLARAGLLGTASGHRAAGFTLVSAIFLMVVLAVLGGSLVTLSSTASTTSAQLLQSVRADYAARAGVEWAINKAGANACTSTTLSPGGALTGFSVAVTCTPTTHPVSQTGYGGGDYDQTYYVVNVTATYGTWGTPDYVMRKAQAKVIGQLP